MFMIKLYQKHISSVIKYMFGGNCRFIPTCSEYGKQAFVKHDFIKALFLSIKRVLKCNPFTKGGYDPLK